jgi:catechol 2,3-dioxygenase-like lactoylglutathione lyase family enzyme
MLSNKPVHATLPAVDIKRARKFYEGKLGLKVVMEDPSPGILFAAGEGTLLYIYQREATKADHTVAEFTVDDIAAEMKDLRAKGIAFEEYDLPGLKTVKGLFTMATPEGDYKAAWFKDSEGNILAMEQLSPAGWDKIRHGKQAAAA